jgi:hypothetical protein
MWRWCIWRIGSRGAAIWWLLNSVNVAPASYLAHYGAFRTSAVSGADYCNDSSYLVGREQKVFRWTFTLDGPMDDTHQIAYVATLFLALTLRVSPASSMSLLCEVNPL